MDAVVTMTDTQPSMEALYRADAERLWRALYAYAGDAEIASDAVNEAYVQLIGRGDAVRDPAAWVWRTAFLVARGALQARRSGDRGLARDPAADVELDRYVDPDLITALRRLPEAQRAAVILFYYADLPIRPMGQTPTSYHISMDVADRAGVLAAVATAFAEHGVSINTVRQQGRGDDATLVIVTHVAPDSALASTVEHLRRSDVVRAVTSVMRVEGER